MSVIHIPRKHLRQPQGRVAVAYDTGAVFAFCGSAGPVELVTGKSPVNFSSEATNPFVVDKSAVGYRPLLTNITTGHYFEVLPHKAPTTMTVVFEISGLHYGDHNYLGWGVGGVRGAGITFLGGTFSPEGSTPLGIRATTFGFADINFPMSSEKPFERPARCVVRFTNQKVAVWINGSLLADLTTPGYTPPAITDTLKFGYLGSVNNAFRGATTGFVVLEGARPDAECSAMSRGFWQLFRADPIRVYSLPSGPISISWSSLTASNITQTGARLTLGGITR